MLLLHRDIGATQQTQISFYQLPEHPDILVQEWKGFFLGEEIVRGHQKVLELVAEHGFKAILSEISELEGSFDEVNEWLVKVFNMEVLRLGAHYEAIIQSKDIFAQISLDELSQNLQEQPSDYTIKLFDNYQEAIQWLCQQIDGQGNL
jgi:hypothetical protein